MTSLRAILQTTLGRALVAVVVLLGVGTLVGLVALRPDGDRPPGGRASSSAVQAEVDGVRAVGCRTSQASECRAVAITVSEGARSGERATLRLGESLSDFEPDVGDTIRVVRNEIPADAVPGGADQYSMVDFERRSPMLWFAILFAVLVVVFGRRRGALALVGLGASVAVIFAFVIPAILDGRPAASVAVVGALAIMLSTIPLAHGIGPKSVAAVLGTSVSLVITVGLGLLAIELAHLTGFSSEESTLVLAGRPDLSLEGLVLAGMIIAALGVLDDVTVSQSSAVFALRRANPALALSRLYRSALDIGHDHVAATVNTLVLAYAGSALPVLLIFSLGGVSFGDAINSEAVAVQVLGTLVGSIGLIAAVPVTTALAAMLALSLPADALPDHDGHHH